MRRITANGQKFVAWGNVMKKYRKDSVANTSPKRQGRREFLIKTGGILAAGAFPVAWWVVGRRAGEG